SLIIIGKTSFAASFPKKISKWLYVSRIYSLWKEGFNVLKYCHVFSWLSFLKHLLSLPAKKTIRASVLGVADAYWVMPSAETSCPLFMHFFMWSKKERGTLPNSSLIQSFVESVKLSNSHRAGKPYPYVKLTNFPTSVSSSQCVSFTSALKNFAFTPGAYSPQCGFI